MVHKLILPRQATSKEKVEELKDGRKKLKPGNGLDLELSGGVTFVMEVPVRGFNLSERKT